jgi:hypothetical protein
MSLWSAISSFFNARRIEEDARFIEDLAAHVFNRHPDHER